MNRYSDYPLVAGYEGNWLQRQLDELNAKIRHERRLARRRELYRKNKK